MSGPDSGDLYQFDKFGLKSCELTLSKALLRNAKRACDRRRRCYPWARLQLADGDSRRFLCQCRALRARPGEGLEEEFCRNADSIQFTSTPGSNQPMKRTAPFQRQPCGASASLQLCLSTAQIVGCAFQLWLETQRCFEFRDALLGLPGCEEGQSQIVMNLRTIGIQPQRLVKLINGLRESVQPPQRDSKIVTNVCVFWCQL